jgi:hypothetical protein
MAKNREVTTRALLALVTDLADMTDAHERVRMQVVALAAAHGVLMPPPSPSR